MTVNANTWSDAGENNARLTCPSCGAGLPPDTMSAGQRLARCKQCGQMLRRPVRRNWPGSPAAKLESAPTAFSWGDYQANTEGLFRPEPGEKLELAPSYPYPALQCPYCEHVNQDQPRIRASGQQFCANCGADLKKNCLSCDASLYVLDHYCTHCRTDQEKLKYEIEGLYWQHYNEGKRLAQLGRWEDAERELSLFFNPQPGLDPGHVRQARQIYVKNIAPYDGGEGLRLYNECIEQLRLADEAYQRQLQRRKYQKWGMIAALVVALGIFSSMVFGSWLTIFVLIPLVAVGIALLVLFILSNLGLG
ncbi:MAG TPA: hypothetical protein VH186_35765 [Chloroflexia bacterium]|nr:hypothetical protein [Chloroflexia bacterium]